LLLCGVVGFAYGCALLALGFILAGAGHGTFVFIGLFSAPVGLAQNVPMALLALSSLWAIMAVLAGSSDRWRLRLVFLCVMCSHYFSLPWILSGRSKFADWEYMKKIPDGWIGLALGVYGAGQLALWGLFLVRVFRRRLPADDGAQPQFEQEEAE
jgi:hypothetical protein